MKIKKEYQDILDKIPGSSIVPAEGGGFILYLPPNPPLDVEFTTPPDLWIQPYGQRMRGYPKPLNQEPPER